jgi:hypothetical protein
VRPCSMRFCENVSAAPVGADDSVRPGTGTAKRGGTHRSRPASLPRHCEAPKGPRQSASPSGYCILPRESITDCHVGPSDLLAMTRSKASAARPISAYAHSHHRHCEAPQGPRRSVFHFSRKVTPRREAEKKDYSRYSSSCPRPMGARRNLHIS